MIKSNSPNSSTKPRRDRSRLAQIWYHFVQCSTAQIWIALAGLRATGQKTLPQTGGALLVCNHLSHLDVFVLGILVSRPFNYVARSTLFFFPLGALIKSVGGFPIQRDGLGAQGVKETLRRLKNEGIVTFFPEGTRSPDGELGELKPGLAALAARTNVPIIPAGIAGSFEAWPKHQRFPRPHPIRVHYGEPILPHELKDKSTDEIMEMIRVRMLETLQHARSQLQGDLLSCP